jgi:hypothetical protein
LDRGIAALSEGSSIAVALQTLIPLEEPFDILQFSLDRSDPHARKPETERLLVLGFDPRRLDDVTLSNFMRPLPSDAATFATAVTTAATLLESYETTGARIVRPSTAVVRLNLADKMQLLTLPKIHPSERLTGVRRISFKLS